MRVFLALITVALLSGCGDGAFKRMTTMGGVYTVCRPGKYPVVCFLDSDSDSGGLFCMPLSQVGDQCL